MGNCCARLLYKFTKKEKEGGGSSSGGEAANEENWGDDDWDIEAPADNISTGTHGRARNSFSQEESVPFIHPNTIKTSVPSACVPRPVARPINTGPLLKSKAGWVVRKKEKKIKKSSSLLTQPVSSEDPFLSMGMTAKYTDDQKIRVKKTTSAVLGSGARSLEEDAFEDSGGGWGDDDDGDDI